MRVEAAMTWKGQAQKNAILEPKPFLNSHLKYFGQFHVEFIQNSVYRVRQKVHKRS